MSIEWDSLILGGNELKTVGPATENARRANSVRAAEERRQSASVWPALRRSTYHGNMAAWTSSVPCGSAPRSCT